MTTPIRILLVGAGHMGTSHGRANADLDGFELCGVVTRGDSEALLADVLGDVSWPRRGNGRWSPARSSAIIRRGNCSSTGRGRSGLRWR